MIANLWPEEAHLEECVSTLRFSSRVRCLQTDAQVNESGDPLLALKKAERQIRELQQELAMRDMLAGRGRVVYEDLSDGERLELQQLVLRYLSGATGGGCSAVHGCHAHSRIRLVPTVDC
jgi:kinesin family protein 6/9